ncbi:MAG: cyclic pyranopterin monophosphate synthase MoaC [Clostridia bacterium]
MEKLSHLDEKGAARMVDVAEKAVTSRTATAQGRIIVSKEILQLIAENRVPKGDVIAAARIAGIMATKRTADLIPMCHPIGLGGASVDFRINEKSLCIEIEATVKSADKTGVEMEALTAVSVAALTIYDMCKSVDKKMVIQNIYLVKKTGGKSGTFKRDGAEPWGK